MTLLELPTTTQGGRLRQERVKSGLSSRQLGALIFCVGATIRAKEVGIRVLTERDFRLLSENTSFNANWIRDGI